MQHNKFPCSLYACSLKKKLTTIPYPLHSTMFAILACGFNITTSFRNFINYEYLIFVFRFQVRWRSIKEATWVRLKVEGKVVFPALKRLILRPDWQRYS